CPEARDDSARTGVPRGALGDRPAALAPPAVVDEPESPRVQLVDVPRARRAPPRAREEAAIPAAPRVPDRRARAARARVRAAGMASVAGGGRRCGRAAPR